ncbi:MAG: type II secretion system F family protein [Erysipelotrichia bacterium]|nr:type II secretion system F family protein [Erysipelotrichia bacterium]
MLYSYKGINKEYKYKRGMIEAKSDVEAISKIKETEDVIVLVGLTRTSSNKMLVNIRTSLNKQLEIAENKLNEQTKKLIRKDREKKLKKKTVDKEQDDSLANRSPILRGINTLANKLKAIEIKMPKKSSKKIVIEEDMFENLQNMFKQAESLEAIKNTDYNKEIIRAEESLSSQKVKKAPLPKKKDKNEGKKLDWSLLETKDTPEIKNNMKIKVKQKEIIMMTRRLHIMLSSGVPLLSSLESIKNTSSEKLAQVLESIISDVQRGITFSEALSKFPRLFDTTYIALISIGETSGTLEKSLEDVLRVKDQEQKVKRKIKVASVYPAIISIVLVVFMIAANLWFIPQFKNQFEQQGLQLPAFTRIVFKISDYFAYIAIGLGILIAIFIVLKRNIPEVNYMYRRYYDKLKLKFPVIKKLNNASYMYSFAINISLMLKNGIRLSDTLTLTGKTIDNIYIRNEIEEIGRLMVQGLTFSEAISQQEDFDSTLTSIAMTGEKSGRMAFALQQVAEYYEQELTRQIDSLLEMVQPVTLLLIGLIIGPIIIAVYLPILNMSSGAGII